MNADGPKQWDAVWMPESIKLPADLAAGLAEAAASAIRAGVSAVRAKQREGRGATLKPGPETPLWNALAAATRAQLKHYGEKARLARVLGLPRQRVHELITSPGHMPDAERTLQLLLWLQARREGRDLC